MFLSAPKIASLLQQKPASDFAFTGISTDTRTVQPGFLFVALAGESTDGHNFITDAIKKGAKGIVHRNDFPTPSAVISFPVADTLLAYRKLAHAWRKEFSFPVLAVCGSAGKTTSKELLAAILRGKYKSVLQTLASQNGFTGIPATMLRLTKETDIAVIEVGIDEPGAMEQHLEIVDPDGGLLSSIGPEHLEKLIDVKTVAEEETKLFTTLEKRKGLIAINADDPYILAGGKKLQQGTRLSYGIENASAQIRARIIPKGDLGDLVVTGFGPKEEHFPLPLEGSHNAQNLLGALTLAHLAGCTPDEMRKGLSSFKAPPGRSEVHSWRGVKVYADTYNANPASVTAALEMLKPDAKSTVWACLGDMLELGTLEESLHRSLADPIQKAKVGHVFLFGDRMKNLESELKLRNYSGEVRHFSDLEALAEELSVRAKAGDRILLKGSRGMRMERAWESLAKKA